MGLVLASTSGLSPLPRIPSESARSKGPARPDHGRRCRASGGASPRLSPTIDAPTASALLQRAGFDLPVTDQETITLTYLDSFALMRDLRGMGETNAHAERVRHFTRRAVFAECERLYQERYGADGRISATFEIVFLHGWKSV